MVEVGPLNLTVLLDLSRGFKTNMNTLQQSLDRSQVRGKELNSVFDIMTGSLGKLSPLVKGLGLGVLGFITAAVAMSPQLKVMFARLQPILFQLGNYIGEKLSPLFDKVVEGAGRFVDKLIEIDEKYGILDTIASLGSQAIDLAIAVDDQTDGALSFLMAASGAAVAGGAAYNVLKWALTPVLSVGSGLLGWIAGALGISAGGLTLTTMAGGLLAIAGIGMILTIGYKFLEDPEKALHTVLGGGVSEATSAIDRIGGRDALWDAFKGQGAFGLSGDVALAIYDVGAAIRGIRQTAGLEQRTVISASDIEVA